jgi:hypothetical protein
MRGGENEMGVNIKGGYELNGDKYILVQFDATTELVVALGDTGIFDTLVSVTENGKRVAPSSRPDVLAAMYGDSI